MRHLPRGTVTLLFTDMEGSTRLLQQVGERYTDLLEECRQLLRTSFHQWNGNVVDTQGDAFFVAFARATDAVSGAVAAQRALASHAWPEGVVVRVRMGLHTGEPMLSAENYIGLDVHHAARIMSAGHGGQVLLSQTTRELVEHDLPDDVSLRDLGAHRLKDLQHPSHLFQLIIGGLPADFPPLKTLDTHPNNLPVQLTSLIGREQEITTVQRLLSHEDLRLLTLTGPGGTGKTRLGLQVAAELSDRLADGVFFVNLAPIGDPALVVPTIAQTLEVKETGNQSLLDLLKVSLRDKHLLLLLDNFEQVISAASQVTNLLAACPKLKIVVTSRAVLHVRGEQEFAVPPLAVPNLKSLPDLVALSQYEAVALFISRAQAVKPDFQVTNANARAVAEICARLDGLPLAIELAAARIKLLPPQALLARLGQRLVVLTSGARDVPARQQTLRNTIEWSYHLLDAEDQRLFRQLSVFVGGCTLQAIEAVCAALDKSIGAGRMLDGVASLIDKSLLQQSEQAEEEPRLMMLETIREYGLEVLEASGEMEITRQAHALYYLRFAEEVEPELLGPRQAVWIERLEREHDNLRAALNWLLERGEARESSEMALRLGASLWDFWGVRSHHREGWTFLERALERSEGSALSVRAKALLVAGDLIAWLGDFERGEALCQQSLALFRESGDVAGVGTALFFLGIIEMWKNNLSAARSRLEASLSLQQEVGDKHGMAWTFNVLSVAVSLQGEYTKGRSHAEASLLLLRELGDTWSIANTLINIAEGFLNEGDAAMAHSLLEESLVLLRELGDKDYEAYALGHLGRVAFQQGNVALAHSLLEEGLTHLQAKNELSNLDNKAWVLAQLAQVVACEGDDTRARALYEQCLTIARKLPFQLDTPFYLEGLAGVVAAQGELPWAARLWGAAEALREAQGTPLPPISRADYERSVTAARTQLGEQAFAVAWAQGRSMTLDQVLTAREPVTMSMSFPITQAPSPPPEKSLPTYPDGLTAREVEILRLVAQGLTNEQVAQQLVISPRTVNTHLTSIFSKIGASSRSAATRYAMEHHLV